jgi:hypothetical protein
MLHPKLRVLWSADLSVARDWTPLYTYSTILQGNIGHRTSGGRKTKLSSVNIVLKIAVFKRRFGLVKTLWPSAPHYFVFYRLPSFHSLRHKLDLLPNLHRYLLLLSCAYLLQLLSDPYFIIYCESLTSTNHTNSQLKGCATLFELCQSADFPSPSQGMSGV